MSELFPDQCNEILASYNTWDVVASRGGVSRSVKKSVTKTISDPGECLAEFSVRQTLHIKYFCVRRRHRKTNETGSDYSAREE